MPASVVTISEMRDWESASWKTGISQSQVIDNVGRILAGKICEVLPAGGSVLIIAGKGHNGDDARAAIPHLKDTRYEICDVTSSADIQRVIAALAEEYDLIVDGVFGIGLSRPLDKDHCELIRAINQNEAPILSVDVPSGLNADTGESMGEAVKATFTLTLAAVKQGLLKTIARPYLGRLEVAVDIGLIAKPASGAMQWILAEDFKNFPPHRKTFSHKGDYGHLGIIAGSKGFHGAAVLASRAAQRASPGLISLQTMPEVYQPVASQLQSVMVDMWEISNKIFERLDAIMIGPGLASKTVPDSLKTWARETWRNFAGPMLVDASALDWLKDLDKPQANHRAGIRVVTPHPGEAARILNSSVADVEADRPNALRSISQKLDDCWVILKGAQTLIGNASSVIMINSSGNPRMAQGGSGDVLSGYLAGLLAQPTLQKNPLKTISFAVWQHGATADVLEKRRKNWVIEELAQSIGSY